MLRLILLLIVASVVTVSGPAQADKATQYKVDAFEWTIKGPLPSYPEARLPATASGIANYLSDRQTLWSGSGYDYQSRFAYEVIDRSGLEEGARVSIAFDPEDTTLSFVSLSVHRDGEEIDRLIDAEITELRQESGLESNLLDGKTTLVINLEDLRVGDVVDYTYQGRVETPLWPDEYFGSVSVKWSVPLAVQTFRLLYPKARNLNVIPISTDLEVMSAQNETHNEFYFRIEDPDPRPNENNVPSDIVSYGYVAFSSMAEWSSVVDWAMDLYGVDNSLPESTIAKLDKIAKDHASENDRIVEALRLVQQEIRYLGIESGLGSHKPRTPRETVLNGYGDCKDKSLLLATMLSYLGVDAQPALASLSAGHQLRSGPISVAAFDHVIVHVKHNGMSVWLDPTMSHQGGRLDTLVVPDYGYALPIRSGVNAVEEIIVALPDSAEISSIEQFTLPEEGEYGVEIDIETRYTGAEADIMRRRLASTGQEKMARSYHDFYTQYYEGIEVAEPFSTTDDFDQNELIITESYKVLRGIFDKEMATKTSLVPHIIRGLIPSAVEANRRSPLALPYGVKRDHLFRIYTPGRMFGVPEDTILEAPGISFSQVFSAKSEWLDIAFSITIDERFAKMADIPEILDIADKISKETDLSINPSAASPTYARRLNLNEPLSTETEADLQNLNSMIIAKKNVAAIAFATELLGKNTESNELRGYLQLIKGALLLDLNRNRSAKSSLREAFALHEPSTSSIYLSYANLLWRDDEDVEAARIITRMLNTHSDSITTLSLDWLRRVTSSLHIAEENQVLDDLYIAAATSQYAAGDDFDVRLWLYAAAIEPLIERDRLSEARQFADLIIDPEMLILLKMDRATEPIWPTLDDRSDDHFSKLIDDFIEVSAAEVEETPDDFKVQARYLNALLQAGRFEDGFEHGASVTSNWSQIEAVGKDAFWFVNEYASVLSHGGRFDEADELIDKLLEFGLEDNPTLVGIAINQSIRQLNSRKFDEALATAQALEASDDDYANEYGKMWLYSTMICALSETNQQEQAGLLFEEKIKPIMLENKAALTKVYLCMNREQDAAETLIARLDSESDRTGAIRSFIEPSVDWRSRDDFFSELQTRLSRVKSRPEVMAKFTEVARSVKVSSTSTYWGDF